MPTLEFKGKSFVYAHHLSVPFRELVVDAKKSLPAKGQKPSLNDNLIIHGDNLHALKALLPVYAGKVDCIYIDPPYNTGNEGWCYNDNVRSPLMREWLKDSANPVDKEDLERHDKWLCMMWPRLKLLHELLADTGVIVVSIDDCETHRLRNLCDEVFGEEMFVACIVWQKRYSRENREAIGDAHEYLLIYCKDPGWFKANRNLEVPSEGQLEVYRNGDSDDPREKWRGIPMTAQGFRKNQMYPITTPSGVTHLPPEGRCWSMVESEFKKLLAAGRIYFGKSGDAQPSVIRYAKEIEGFVPWTWWPSSDAGHTDAALKELYAIMGRDSGFPTPKPSTLIRKLLAIVTQPDSIVLDSFAGSGTTAHAVLALNRKDGGNRKFILVECEDYADKVTAERVRRVIQGYKFQGTQREELLREPLTWTKLKKARELVEKADAIEKFEAKAFDKITKTVEDGTLVVTGEKKITEKADGLGGSFAFVTLGTEISIDTLLTNGLPAFESLAKYVFYTATGRTVSELPKGKAAKLGCIGETEMYRVHLHYQPEREWLQSNDAALTEKLLDEMQAANSSGKRLLVFAAAKFMSQRELTERGVEFCQLPYAIHRILGD